MQSVREYPRANLSKEVHKSRTIRNFDVPIGVLRSPEPRRASQAADEGLWVLETRWPDDPNRRSGSHRPVTLRQADGMGYGSTMLEFLTLLLHRAGHALRDAAQLEAALSSCLARIDTTRSPFSCVELIGE